ncbi:MAG: ring-opening amidohydrolase [Chloroflexia bacterium]
MQVTVHKLPMRSPDDLSALRALLDSGQVRADQIAALQGKCEGDGFARRLASGTTARLLAPYLNCTPEEVERRIPMVWSVGADGVISPHVTLFTRDDSIPGDGRTPRLVLGTAFADPIAPEELGRMAQVRKMMVAIRAAMADAGLDNPADLHFVQTKVPALTSAQVAAARADGLNLATEDARQSGDLSTAAATFATALVAGELTEVQVNDSVIGRDANLYSNLASSSSGAEIVRPQVLVFGMSTRGAGPFAIGHGVMRDAIDAAGIRDALRSAGLVFDHLPTADQLSRVVAAFAKASPDPRGTIRGRRHVMLDDASMPAHRHIRAAVGAVIASVIGDTAVYVSSGTRHQGPPGGGPIAIIVRLDP